MGKFFSLMREDDSTRVVHYCAQTVGIECLRNIRGRPALCTISGHQKPSVRHRSTKFGELLRISCTDHGAYGSVAALAERFTCQLFDVFTNMAIEWSAI